MSRASRRIGARLAFALPRGDAWRRVTMDYALPAGASFDALARAAHVAARREEALAGQGLRYVGTEDLFWISGSVRAGALLGATDHDEATTLAQASRLATAKLDEDLPRAGTKLLLADVVYFAGGTSYGSFATVAQLALRSNRARALADAAELAVAPRTIARLRASGIDAASIDFVGVREVALLPKRARLGRFGSDLYLVDYPSARGPAERVKPKRQLRSLYNAILCLPVG